MLFISHKLVGNKVKVIGKDFFYWYKSKSKYRNKKKINESKHLNKVLNSIYRKIREDSYTYTGGVYMKNFFYIIPQEVPRTKKFAKILNQEGKQKTTMNLHSKGKIYSFLFTNLMPEEKFGNWCMNNQFSKILKKNFSEFIFSNKNLKYIYNLDSLIKIVR